MADCWSLLNLSFRFRLYDETRLLPSRFLFQVQQRVKAHRNASITSSSSSSSNNANKAPGSHHQPTVIEGLSAYQSFVDSRDATCRKISSNETPCQEASNSSCTTNGILGNRVPPNVYESYVWRPTGSEGPPRLPRNPQQGNKTPSTSTSSTALQGEASQRPTSKAARSATLM